MAHVIKLSVDSYRRITAVDIAPPQVQVVGGRNGQGKTSLLDAICVALFGPKWDATTEPIHEGSDTATIVVGLDDVAGHGPLTVTRTYRVGKAGAVTTKVEVTRPDGSTLSAPQTVLDELIGRLGACLLYTSDAADDLLCVGLGGRRILQKKKSSNDDAYK